MMVYVNIIRCSFVRIKSGFPWISWNTNPFQVCMTTHQVSQRQVVLFGDKFHANLFIFLVISASFSSNVNLTKHIKFWVVIWWPMFSFVCETDVILADQFGTETAWVTMHSIRFYFTDLKIHEIAEIIEIMTWKFHYPNKW